MIKIYSQKAFPKLLFVALFSLTIGCGGDDDKATPSTNCGTHNGNKLQVGPEGGCYYINANGNKTYVDRSECKC